VEELRAKSELMADAQTSHQYLKMGSFMKRCRPSDLSTAASGFADPRQPPRQVIR
jgi:hypothetical protein